MEIIIALIIIIFLAKYIFFDVKINSVLFLIASVVMFFWKPEFFPNTGIALVLLILNAIDCIRDVVVSYDYYGNGSKKMDGMYALKSLSSVILIIVGCVSADRNLALAFIPRAVFLLLIYPIEYLKVSSDVNSSLEAGLPIPVYFSHYSSSRKDRYWYNKVINSLLENNKIISNEDTVSEEVKCSEDKLSKNYPEGMLNELLLSVFDKQKKEKLNQIKEKLKDYNVYKHVAYVSKEFYAEFGDKLYAVIVGKKAPYSTNVIRTFPELKMYKLNSPNGISGDTEWSEFFISKILNGYVKKGKLKDFTCSDEPLDNHAYGVSIKSHNASDDPRLALDD